MRQRQYLKFLGWGVVALLAFGFRFYSIGKQSYWLDEMVSLNIAKTGGWQAFRWDNSPFLYHLLLQHWVAAFGDNELVVRLLSLLFSVGATILLTRFAWLEWGWHWGLFMGVSHCLSSLSIMMAQEARMYALLEFAVSLNLVLFFEFYWKGKKGLAYLFSLPFLAVCHFLGAVPVVLQCGWLIHSGKSRQSKVYGGWLLGIMGVFTALALSFWVRSQFLNWQILKFNLEPDSRWPKEILQTLSNYSDVMSLALVGLLGLSLVAARKTGWRQYWRSENFFLWSFVGLPLLMATAFSLAAGRAVLLPRYFIFVVPYFVAAVTSTARAMVGKGFTRELSLEERGFRVGTLFLLLLMGLGTVASFSQTYQIRKAPWREVAQTVKSDGGWLVLTDKTLALRVPYFEERGIELVRWPPGAHPLSFLVEQFQRSPTVWVLEDYWGGREYLPKLKEKLDEQGFETHDQTFELEGSPQILALKVLRPNSK